MDYGIKISIIMPIFNARKYIDAAISSILNQTYNNYEVLIIDDGATDGTGERCREFAERYSFIRYIRQKNGGACAARNKGIEIASGDYITFLDHDDEYKRDYLEELLKLALKYDLDEVKCGVHFVEDYSDGTIKVKDEYLRQEVLSQSELIQRYNTLPISFFAVWNTLYKTSVIKENHVRFPENVRHGQEDYYFNTEILPFIRKVGFDGHCRYIHYRRISQSTSAKYYPDRIEHMSMYFKRECEILRPLISKEKWNVEYALLYVRKITGLLSYIWGTIEHCSNKEYINILNDYIENTVYSNSIFIRDWMKLLTLNVKYSVILYLVQHRHYTLLITLWKAWH